MKRRAIALKTRSDVLKEFNHKCAICGKDNPHLHHIDENNANSDADNLIPLCPNCHLSDQHNPTRRISQEILRVFREFKDPVILSPNFKPLFNRYFNVYCVKHDESGELGFCLQDLKNFVRVLKMGEYYSTMINNESEYRACYANFDDFIVNGDFDHDAFSMHCLTEQIRKVTGSRKTVLQYVVELARYQDWHR